MIPGIAGNLLESAGSVGVQTVQATAPNAHGPSHDIILRAMDPNKESKPRQHFETRRQTVLTDAIMRTYVV